MEGKERIESFTRKKAVIACMLPGLEEEERDTDMAV